MPGRVSRLDLNVRGPSANERELRAGAERFARGVLDRFCAIIEERFPGREIVIRRLDLRYSLGPNQLSGSAEAALCAADLAETISAWLEFDDAAAGSPVRGDRRATADAAFPLRSRPPAGPDGAYGGDDRTGRGRLKDRPRAREAVRSLRTAQAAAGPGAGAGFSPGSDAFERAVVRLVSLARQGKHASDAAWLSGFWRDLEPEGAPSPEVRKTIALAALSHLDASRDMIAVLAGLAPAALHAVADALGVEPALLTLARQWDEVPSRRPDPRKARAVATPDRKAVAARSLEALLRDFPPSLAPEAAAIALHVRSATSQIFSAPAGGGTEGAAAPAATPPDRAPPANASPTPDAVLLESEAAPERDAGLQTQFGGLFYLLSLALELGVGEFLWKVCLPEGQVLASAAAAILGDEARFDIAPTLCGGLAPGEPLEPPPISSEQQEAACREILAGLVAALARLGVGALTAPILDLVDRPAGALLIAHAGFPVPIFAWPAPDPAALAVAVDVFLGVWPQALAAPSASDRVLADSPRTLRRSDPSPDGARCFLPEAGASAAADALLAQLCGAVLHLFHARLVAFGGEPAADCAALVSRYLELPGRIALGPESLTVILPMDRIDIGLRRAGLDRDPGWAPWLRRTVRIEFEAVGPEQVL